VLYSLLCVFFLTFPFFSPFCVVVWVVCLLGLSTRLPWPFAPPSAEHPACWTPIGPPGCFFPPSECECVVKRLGRASLCLLFGVPNYPVGVLGWLTTGWRVFFCVATRCVGTDLSGRVGEVATLPLAQVINLAFFSSIPMGSVPPMFFFSQPPFDW